LRSAGFSSLDRDAEHYGLGLALGNGDVTLIELANGYRGLVNGGTWTPWKWTADGGNNSGNHSGNHNGNNGGNHNGDDNAVKSVRSDVRTDLRSNLRRDFRTDL